MVLEKIYIPPMAGVTDLVFRRLIRHILGDEARHVRLSTEMVSSKGMMYQDNPHRLRLESNEHNNTVIQLFGHEADTMAAAAKIAESAGARLIDINMGCPVPKITNGKDGAALMKEPDLAVDIVKSVIDAVDIPVSVKTRLGWNEEQRNIQDFALRLQDAGVHSLTIHGRTRKQAYTGVADWDAIAEVQQLLSVPVFANGDITSPDKAVECLGITKSSGVAIARAVIGNPWLIKNTVYKLTNRDNLQTQPSLRDKAEILRLHFDWAYEDKGTKGIQALKKHVGNYIKDFPHASKWRNAIVTEQAYDGMNDSINKLLEFVE